MRSIPAAVDQGVISNCAAISLSLWAASGLWTTL